MPEIFQYSFMVRALLAGLLVAITVPVMGTFLVARRYALIADSLAHVSLAGVGAGLLLGTSPILVAVPVTMIGGLLIEYLRQDKKISGETSLAILMSSGLAIAIVLANLSHGVRADFTSYLFGSITTTSVNDVTMLGAAAAITLLIIAMNYRAFVHLVFDEDSARIAGYKVSLLNYLLAAMTAMIVVLSLRIVGGLLISALLVMPVVSASQFAKSFALTIVLAVIFAVIAVITGLTLAFYAGIAAGGAIVLAALAMLVLALLLKS